VRITIDARLQKGIIKAFDEVKIYDNEGNTEIARQLHGAVVVIDVPSGEVLALVSAPTYDPNQLDDIFAQLADDDLNHPLLNRATMAQLEPGSTMKPIVGLGGIHYGVIRTDTGIECTGYMVRPNGKPYPRGRCWVASKFEGKIPSVAHHPIPIPHPTGFLTFSDALERSCNVFFETVADRLGLDRLSEWDEQFGFGRITGLGIGEARGRLPDSFNGPALELRQKTWFSGIGQSPVAATPIQMANAAATLARGGEWLRPRLISEADAKRLGITLPALKGAPRKNPEQDDDDPAVAAAPVDRIFPEHYDLGLSPESKSAVRDGMTRVVYGDAGTGKGVVRDVVPNGQGRGRLTRVVGLEGIPICAKTGTAQAPQFQIKERDPVTGKVLVDEQGRMKMRALEPYMGPSQPGEPPHIAPWYRGGGKDGRELAHAWYIGFAPADNPKVAFAVMVEYGGSGGSAAAAIARETLLACVEHGYLKGSAPAVPAEKHKEARSRELLQDVAGR
jgi:penicillin-binding protein 2